MGLINMMHTYYGRLTGHIPARSFVDDLIIEKERQMVEDLKQMEDRLKRHITECKREIIKELTPIQSEKKEKKNDRKSK